MRGKNQFSVVLPRNSSYHVYPDNKTTHFITYLPQQIDLDGEWCVALTEIQIPMTMYHIKKNLPNRRVVTEVLNLFEAEGKYELKKKDTEVEPPELSPENESFICPGMYGTLESLLDELNSMPSVQEHFHFLQDRGGFVSV